METFNFGVKDGVRGFFTNPSRADDSFIPFSTRKTFKSFSFSQSTNGSTVSQTYDLKDKTDNYADLRLYESLFVMVTETYHTYATSTIPIKYKYDSETGTLTITMSNSMGRCDFTVYYQE